MDDKNALDTFTMNALIDLYGTIAGITRGYLSKAQKDFNLTKAEAQEEMLKIDKTARDKVAEAYYIYDATKKDEDNL